MDKKYNMKSPGVKRLMREAMELKDPTPMYFAQPLEDNLFEWHFTIQAPHDTDFDGGLYHGRILLPTEYPMKPPSIIMLTPNGRFEVHHKICLSASAYHPELWQPSWSIRTVLLALIGFMPTEGVGAIGSLDAPPHERRRLARCSLDWVCPECGVPNKSILPPEKEGQVGRSDVDKTMAEAADILSQMTFKSATEVEAQKKKLAQDTNSPANRETSSQAACEASSQAQVPSNSDINTGPRQRLHPPPPPTGLSSSGDMAAENSRQTHTQAPSSAAANVSVVPPTVKRTLIQTNPADMPQSSRRATNFLSLVLIWVFLLAIAVLVMRRIYIMS